MEKLRTQTQHQFTVHPSCIFGITPQKIINRFLERVINQQRENARGDRSRGRAAPVINQTIQVTGTLDGRTPNQIANESARKQRIVGVRFG